MNTTHEFNPNKVFDEEDTYNALVEHFNKIENFGKKASNEFLVEEPSTEDYNITFDYSDGLKNNIESVKKFFLFCEYKLPENFEQELTEYVDKLVPYIDGYSLNSHGMFRGQSFLTEGHIRNTFEEIIDLVAGFKENNKIVFLWQVYKKPIRSESITIDDITYPKDESVYYKVRCGVLERTTDV